MEKWITVKNAAQIRKCSERNIIHLIQAGKLKARKDGKRWLILKDVSEFQSEEIQKISEVISALKAQLKQKDAQISNLHDQLEHMRNDLAEMREDASDASERHDTIVLQLTRQLEQSQRLLEYHQEPWYRKIFRRTPRHEETD